MRVARAESARTSGAAAGLVVVAAFGAFGVYVGGDVPWVGLPAMTVATLAIAVLPGWILGSHIRPTLRSTLLGTIAYALLAWALWVPIAIVGSTLGEVRAGSLDGPVAIADAMGSQFAYAVVASLVLWMLALPFAVVWMVAFRAIGRLAAR